MMDLGVYRRLLRVISVLFPTLPSLVYQTQSLPELIGFWFSLDLRQHLLPYRWKRRWDPSRHARLHRPWCPLLGIEGF